MYPSLFNARVPLPARGEVFLLNTFTDAQLVVADEVAELLDRLAELPADAVGAFTPEERSAVARLRRGRPRRRAPTARSFLSRGVGRPKQPADHDSHDAAV